MLLLSVLAHLCLVMGYFSFTDQKAIAGSAYGEGAHGIDVGLGEIGSYADMTNQLLADDAEPEKEPEQVIEPEVKPAKKVVVEPEPEIIEKTPVKDLDVDVKPQPKQPLIQDKVPPVTSAGDYELNQQKTAEKDSSTEAVENTEEENSKPIEQATAVKKEKQPASEASVRGTGSSSDKSTGGFKGSSKDYFSHLMAYLNKYKRYPVSAKKLKQQGVVHLQFTMNPSGNILAKSIKKSSGHQLLDDATLTMLTKASPLPAPPEQLKRERLTLVIPINFSLITNK